MLGKTSVNAILDMCALQWGEGKPRISVQLVARFLCQSSCDIFERVRDFKSEDLGIGTQTFH